MYQAAKAWLELLYKKLTIEIAILGGVLVAAKFLDQRFNDNRLTKQIDGFVEGAWLLLFADQTLPGYLIAILVLVTISMLVALVILARRNAKLQARIGMDSLTNLPTREKFPSIFASYHAKIREKPFCVCYIDIVDLRVLNKQVNHEPANKILALFVDKLKGLIRSSSTDELFRLEGDQFAIIFGDTPLNRAYDSAVRILDSLQKAKYYVSFHAETESEILVNVRCRFGITDCVEKDTFQDCLDRADAALIRAKDEDTSGGKTEDAIRVIPRAAVDANPGLLAPRRWNRRRSRIDFSGLYERAR